MLSPGARSALKLLQGVEDAVERRAIMRDFSVEGDNEEVILNTGDQHQRQDTGGVWGPLMGGPQCGLSNLRNGNVPCRYR